MFVSELLFGFYVLLVLVTIFCLNQIWRKGRAHNGVIYEVWSIYLICYIEPVILFIALSFFVFSWDGYGIIAKSVIVVFSSAIGFVLTFSFFAVVQMFLNFLYRRNSSVDGYINNIDLPRIIPEEDSKDFKQSESL